jgi:hypothetical protein
MAKKISFEDMRAMGDSKIPPEIREYANKLKEQAETEKARSTIVSYIQQSNAETKKKKVLIDTLSKMVSKEKK